MSASASKKKRKELVEQGLSPKDIELKTAKEQKQKTLKNVLIVALAILVCAAAVIGVISLVNRPDYDTKAAVATVGDEKITVPVYNIFYGSNASYLYSNGGYSYFIQPNTPISKQNNIFGEGTMEDAFKSSAASSIQTAYNFYIEAKKNEYKLTDEQKKAISDELDAMDTVAANYGFSSANRFLAANYGKGCTMDDYETYLTVNAYYQGYVDQLREEFKPSAEELQKTYDEDHSAFDLVSFTYETTNAKSETLPADDSKSGEQSADAPEGETSATATPTTTVYTDEAKAEAKKTAEGYLTEMPEDAPTGTYGKSDIETRFSEEIANWLFEDARKEGDTKVFAMNDEETSFCTFRFDSRDDNNYFRVNANILTITKDSKDDTQAADTDQAKTEDSKTETQTAEQKRDALLAAIKDGMSDEDFNKAVTDLKYQVSTTSVTHSYSVQEIKDWLYDAARKPGDLLTSYENDTTYYVVRYVSTDTESYRDDLIKQDLWSKMTTAIAEANTIVLDEELLKHANTDLSFRSATQES